MKLQVDYMNPQADLLLPILLPRIRLHAKLAPAEQSALDILEHWNRKDEADQAAPLIFINGWMNWEGPSSSLLWERCSSPGCLIRSMFSTG